MRLRRGLWLPALIAVVALAGVGVVVVLARSVGADRARDASTTTAAPVATAQVTRINLVETTSVDGLLSHGVAESVESKAAGTLTWLPDVGSVLRRGDVLLRADEKPVIVLYGPLPIYRPLARDVTGDDVEQFESNLRALGYDGFTVDKRYTAATEAAVKRWQRRHGLTESGLVDLPAVVYVPGPVRVASRVARLGASATGAVLTCTPEARVVTAQVPAEGAAWAVAGTEVTVVLPGGGSVAGAVARVGTEAAPAGGAAPGDGATGGDPGAALTVTVTIADQAALGSTTRAPVQVRHTARERPGVLTVPVAALMAPIEGGYAVEVVEGDRTRVVPVETGLFAEGRVEVRGEGLVDGMTVRVPA
jgi:peptidoglycan hydrolase-like protein with peptidoglycan-binding domain